MGKQSPTGAAIKVESFDFNFKKDPSPMPEIKEHESENAISMNSNRLVVIDDPSEHSGAKHPSEKGFEGKMLQN